MRPGNDVRDKMTMRKLQLVTFLIIQGCSSQYSFERHDPNAVLGKWEKTSCDGNEILIKKVGETGWSYKGIMVSEKNVFFKSGDEVWSFVKYDYGGYRGYFKPGMVGKNGSKWLGEPMMEMYLTDKNTLEVIYYSAKAYPLSVYKRVRNNKVKNCRN